MIGNLSMIYYISAKNDTSFCPFGLLWHKIKVAEISARKGRKIWKRMKMLILRHAHAAARDARAARSQAVTKGFSLQWFIRHTRAGVCFSRPTMR